MVMGCETSPGRTGTASVSGPGCGEEEDDWATTLAARRRRRRRRIQVKCKTS
jgi:hypothetical protein